MIMMVAVMFLFFSAYGVMGKSCQDANSPKAACSKDKGKCDKKKCDKKDAKGTCTKDKKKCEDPNSVTGKKS